MQKNARTLSKAGRHQSGTLGRAIPSQHTWTRTLGRQFLGYSRRDACPRPPEGTKFSTKASDSGVVSPAPPNRGMAGFDEKAHATSASVHITVCKACLHAPGLRLLPVAWLRATVPGWQPNSIGNSASVASAIVGDIANGIALHGARHAKSSQWGPPYK